ncbi:MAG: hypothetical protein E6G85_05735 [Alphaproteobacteria bacterium]|nr:MAG: hypothetical protein E6G85_05735 [Alphaproteobacteria bacterium]
MGAVQRLPMEPPMSQHFRFDASRSLTALDQDSTIIAVIEMSQTKWSAAALRRRTSTSRNSMPTRKAAQALASLAPRSRPRGYVSCAIRSARVEQERLRKLAVAPAAEKKTRDGPADCPHPGRWCRNGGHAGQRDLLAPMARAHDRTKA